MALSAARFRVGILIALLLGLTTLSHAQYSASVQGTVTDPAGAVVQGATITLTNVATKISDTTTSSGAGSYHFVNLLPADYKIEVTAAGFEKAVALRHVSTDEEAGVNIALTVGGSSITVNVTAVQEGLNPDEERLQYTLTSQDIEAMPMPDRSTLTTLRVAPGVVGTIETTGSTNTNIPIGQAAPDARANGRANTSNVYLLDRIPISSTENTGAVNMVPNPDMLAEIALQTTSFAVDNGSTTSLQIDMTSKSGGSKFHGDGDISYSSKPLEANPDFSAGVAPFHRKYFMGSLGGPIYKKNTFFFGSIERVENITAQGASTAAISASGIGAWTAAQYKAPQAGWNTAGAAWSKIFTYPASNLTSLLPIPAATTATNAGLSADTSYPNPAFDGGTVAGNQFGQECGTPSTFNLPCDTIISQQGTINDNSSIAGQNYNLRLDHSLREDNDRIYVGYFGTQQNSDDIDPRPAFNTQTPSQTAYFSAGWTHVLTANLSNQFNAGYNRYWGGGVGNPNYTIFPHGSFLGEQSAAGGFLGGPQQSPDSPYVGADSKEHIFALRDYVSWFKGRHSFKLGFQSSFRNYWQNSSANYSRPYGVLFSDVLEMMQGEADEMSLYTIGASGASAGKWVSQVYGAEQFLSSGYVQDDWKIKPNLQVTLGLRWDDYGNPGEYGQGAAPYANTTLGTGSALWDQVNTASSHLVSKAFNNAELWNFLPRGAFTWSPGFAKNLVVRGGVGLYQDSINLNLITANLPTSTPVRITLTLHDQAETWNNFYANKAWASCPNTTGFWCIGQWTGKSAVAGEPNPFAITGTQGTTAPYGFPYPAIPVTGISSRGLALGPNGTIYQSDMYGVDPDLKPQSTMIWNFGLEQELPNSIVVGATYTGSYSYDQLFVSSAFNNAPTAVTALHGGAQPWTDVGKVNLVRNMLSSNYNALILTATQHKGNLSWQGNFLWSHSLGNPGGGDNPSPYTAKAAYGTGGEDVPLRVTLSGSYQLPGGNSVVNKGWSLGAIFIGQEGTPFTVYSSQDVNGDGNKDGNNDLPDYVPQPGSGIHYGKYSNAEYKAGIFNSCVLSSNPANNSSSGALYDSANFPQCPFKTVTTPNPNTLEGNEPYNAFRNPGYWDVDLNLQKKIEMPWFGDQKSHLNLRIEAMNAFNHANLNGFGGSLTIGSSSNFGAIQSAANPRILQIGGRFEF